MLKKYQTLRIWSSLKALDDFIKFFAIYINVVKI